MSTPEISEHHASLMDRIYRSQRHIYDATRKYFLLGRDHALREMKIPENGSLLEVACGTGRNLVHASRLYPTSRLFGLDISSEMLKSAEKAISKHNVKNPVKLAKEDARTFDPVAAFGENGFDRILFSYSISMIPDWETAVSHAASKLNPGGELWIVDFGQQDKLPGWFKSILHSWLTKFHVTPRADLDAVLAKIAEAHGMSAHSGSLYRDYARYGLIKRAVS